jgi:uncharacterized protein (DUF736 family)
MTVIGTFTPTADGYAGHIRTLTIRRRVHILVNEQADAGHAPEFKLLCGDTEIGAAWKATARNGRTYLSVQIDDPSWGRPIRAKLFEETGLAHLVWNRRNEQSDA